MVKLKNNVLNYILLFFIGGYAYCTIEILARGYSHISMLIAGGICFILIGLLNEFVSCKMSFISQMVISAIIITGVEFITGLIVNIWLGLEVWNYSDKPYNLMGQICYLYVGIWFVLSPIAIIADDYIRYWIMGAEKPHYKIL